MPCYKLNDMLIVRKKNEEKLEPILELDSGPLGGPNSELISGFSCRNWVQNQQNRFRVRTGPGTGTIIQKWVRPGSNTVSTQNRPICNPRSESTTPSVQLHEIQLEYQGASKSLCLSGRFFFVVSSFFFFFFFLPPQVPCIFVIFNKQISDRF